MTTKPLTTLPILGATAPAIVQVGGDLSASTVMNATLNLANSLKATLGIIETYAQKIGAHPAADWAAYWVAALGPAPAAASPQAPTAQEQAAINQYAAQVANLTAQATFATTLVTMLMTDLNGALTDTVLLAMLHEANTFDAR